MTLRIIIDVLVVIGAFFALAGTIGIIKMPDTFSRMQASTCVSTLGILCIAAAGLIYALAIKGSTSDAIKIAIVALVIFLTNPIGSHVIAKGAYKSGIRPEKPLNPDDYGRDFDD